MRISNLSNKSGNPSSSDYLVLDNGTTVTKIDYNKLAKAIIENYAGSTVAGSAQSVKAALDSLNSNSAAALHGTLPNNTDLNSVTELGSYLLSGSNSYSNLPSGFSYGLLEVVSSAKTSPIIFQRITDTNRMATRYKSGTNWYPWVIYTP